MTLAASVRGNVPTDLMMANANLLVLAFSSSGVIARIIFDSLEDSAASS